MLKLLLPPHNDNTTIPTGTLVTMRVEDSRVKYPVDGHATCTEKEGWIINRKFHTLDRW